MKHYFFGIFTYFFTTSLVWSQQVVRFTVDDGLSQSFATSIVQDQTGFIWIGTLNGLNRFDGNSFKVYHAEGSSKNGLLSNFIKTLTLDGKGHLWVGTHKGLQYYDERNDHFIAPSIFKQGWIWKKDPISLIEGDRIFLVNRDSLIECTISEKESGILVDEIRTSKFPSEEFGNPFIIMKKGGILWIGTERGVCIWDGDHFQRFYPEIEAEVLNIWEDDVRDLICLETSSGIYMYKNNLIVAHYQGSSTNSGIGMKVRKFGIDYLIAKGGHFLKWDGKTFSKTNFEFGSNITTSCLDRQGNLWVGLDASGVACIQNRMKKIKKTLNVGIPAFKHPLEEPGGDLWLYQKRGVERRSMVDFGEYKSVNPKDPSKSGQFSFQSFHADIDQSGRIWSVDKDLKLREVRSGKVYEKFGELTTLNVDFGVNCLSDGSLLLISHDGIKIAFFNPENGAVIPVPDLRKYLKITWWELSSVSKTNAYSKWLWLTSTKGVVGIRPDWKSGSSELVTLDNEKFSEDLSTNSRFIFAESDIFNPDKVWIGTWSGLFQWDLANQTLEAIKINDGPSEPVFCMAQTREGELWLGTQHGLVNYSLSSKKYRLFNKLDGLPAGEFNRNTAAVLEDGMVVMGTIKGTICFYPKDMLIVDKPEVMVVTMVWNGSTSLPLLCQGAEYHIENLPYGHDNLKVELSMLNFTYMKSIQYRYRFQHGGRQWVNNGLNNSISLAGLIPGKYTLEVQGSLNGNEWSDSAFLSFKVDKPWWASWWAITIFTLVIGIPIILIIRNKILLDREKHENEVLKLESEHKAVLMQTKERVLSNVAHDLKTPLTIITGMAEKIGKDSDEKITSISNSIKQQSEELLHMISQILNLGRLRELGDIPLSPAPLMLDDFITSLISGYAEQANEKQISINTILEPLPEIFIDEIGLKTILGNLFSNAVKFTPKGGKVWVEALVDEDTLEIFVCDSGPGIPEEKAKFLFQRFYQVDGEKYPGGSGIGLAYASEMAKLMGGDLSYTPCEQGSVFKVSFPMDRLELPELSTAGSKGEDPEQYKASENAEQRPMIIIVEDHTGMAAYIKSILEVDYDILLAHDGLSGLEKTIHYIPDLVITDVKLPGLSGLDMCKAMQEDIRASHIPVIILSGKSNSGSIRAGLESGASLYLTKPFDAEVLKQYVSNSLQFVAQTKRYFQSFWEAGQKARNADVELPEGVNSEREDSFIQQVEAVIQAHYSDEEFNIDKLAGILHVSLSQLRRKITALGGESAGVMLRKYRLKKAKELLICMPDASISEIAFLCGFSDPNYFSTAFGKEFAVTPKQFRSYTLNKLKT